MGQESIAASIAALEDIFPSFDPAQKLRCILYFDARRSGLTMAQGPDAAVFVADAILNGRLLSDREVEDFDEAGYQAWKAGLSANPQRSEPAHDAVSDGCGASTPTPPQSEPAFIPAASQPTVENPGAGFGPADSRAMPSGEPVGGIIEGRSPVAEMGGGVRREMDGAGSNASRQDDFSENGCGDESPDQECQRGAVQTVQSPQPATSRSTRKLTDDEVRRIRHGGESPKMLAAEFGVPVKLIGNVRQRHTYRSVPDESLPPDATPGPIDFDAIIKWMASEDIEVEQNGAGYKINGRIKGSANDLVVIANRRRVAQNLPKFESEAAAQP
jgi:hypothetical protein